MSYKLGTPVPDWRAAQAPSGQAIIGDNITLRRLTEADAKKLFVQFNKADTEHDWLYMPFGPFSSETELRTWIASMSGSDDPLFYCMIRNADDMPFGFCSYLNIKPSGGSIEIGFIQIAPQAQRSTLFTEAMYLMANNVFELGYRRYEWKCDALNERSRRAAHRLGFNYEGMFRQALVVKGRNRDTKWFSILDSEWQEISKLQRAWLAPENFDSEGNQRRSLSKMTAPCVTQFDPDLTW